MRSPKDALGYRPMTPHGERTHDSTSAPTENERPTNRVTVADAAQLMGLSAEAVRMRIKRGTLPSEKIEGTVYVILDKDQTRSNEAPITNQTTDQTRSNEDPTTNQTTDQTALVEVLNDHVAYLRGQLDQEREANRENRRIIAGLVQRVPELEAAQEPRDSSLSASEEGGIANDVHPEQQEKPRSWLYRFFFGP
jgi:hypothetical protein